MWCSVSIIPNSKEHTVTAMHTGALHMHTCATFTQHPRDNLPNPPHLFSTDATNIFENVFTIDTHHWFCASAIEVVCFHVHRDQEVFACSSIVVIHRRSPVHAAVTYTLSLVLFATKVEVG